jgi:hypothetical protein
MRHRLATAALAFAAGSLLVVGCSDDDGDEASTCSDLQALATDVRGLTDVDIVDSGLDALRDQLDEIDTAWNTAKESGDEQFGAELDALDDAISTLEDEVSSDDSLSEKAEAVGTDIDAVSTAWDDVTSAVDDEMGDCDLSA